MTAEEARAVVSDLAYLAACAVDGRIPDAERVSRMDLAALYRMSERHLLSGITAMALESAGVQDDAFTQAKGNAIRKAAILDAEKGPVLDALEAAGIWHMPLKGSVIKDLYPKLGMRQMSDIDILFDASKTQDVYKAMTGLGFEGEVNEHSVHDHYTKPPVCNFELHRKLFGESHVDKLVEYYKDVKSRLIPEEGTSFRFRFSPEDFYIYMTAHEYKHYSNNGTGLRSLLDTYVYYTKKGSTMDWAYISAELEKLGIADFEARGRSLALHLFGGEELAEAEQEMLDYISASGTYGKVANGVNNRVDAYGGGLRGKIRYFFSRAFLPMSTVRSSFPLFAKVPVLLPFLPLYRTVRSFFNNRSKMKTELKTLFSHKEKQSR